MINSTIFALVLLIAAVIVVFVIRRKEGFMSGINSYDAMTRNQYIQSSMKKYNPLADQYDVTKPNFARTDDPVKLDQVTAQIKSAMATAEIYPDPDSGSRFDVNPNPIDISLPPPNEILGQARKCEAIQGRGCEALNNPEYRSCGICIKGGTAFSNPDKAGKHVGGLLVLPDDRKEAEAKAGRGEPSYFPTVGECAPGYLYTSFAKCEKAKNRLECEEAGVAGGFEGTMKDLARSKCAQVIDGEGNTYIYEPRGRRFNANLRVIMPTGVGLVGVTVYTVIDGQNKIIGKDSKQTSGAEFVIPVRNLAEGQTVKIEISEQFPHRARGRNEVFMVKRQLSTQEPRGYNETKATSTQLCQSIGARLASKAELTESQRKGAQVCACGQTTNSVSYVMNSDKHILGCGSRGVVDCGTEASSWNQGKGYAWCYGIKPPTSTGVGSYISKIFPFFTGYGDNWVETGVEWSEYGADYQAPAYRGVIMQWESEDGMRIVPFESSIVRVNDVGPSNTSSDGSKTFSNLRRLGTFAKSTMIVAPRPSGRMLKNQFWIWSNQTNSVSMSFDAQVPGIFNDPFYPEDKVIAPRGPLISNPETMKLMRTSPCLRDGEAPGKYSIECLNNLFISSGGDPLRGKLATGGLTQLLKLGDMDEISGYLANLFSIATKGRDAMGNRVGSDRDDQIAKINDAAQKMFGFDLTTPCEDVVEDATGNMAVVPKSSPYNADCLDYLWMNTGNERTRGNEDLTRNTSIKNTYTWLQDRYSGLRSGEGSADKRKKHPFQACQRSGSKAPIGADGKPNTAAIAEANTKGGMDKIQNWYDNIHYRANYTPSNEANNSILKSFMSQCYGVNRIDNVPNVTECDGVKARYVRVLATAVYGINPNNTCIQIPQLQVFDAKNNEVARGKPTSANSTLGNSGSHLAVNGNARPHSHGEGEYHDSCNTPDRQFWMVDLGSTVTVSRVVFYPRTDCCDFRQAAAPVQLLNESKQIVAQQWIGEGKGQNTPMNQIQTMNFTSDLSKPVIPISQYSPGLRVTLMSSTSWDRYLRHSGFAMWLGGTGSRPPETMDLGFRNDATFTLRSARNGIAGVSFESVNYPGHFIRHAGFRCYLHNGTSQLEKDDGSFYTVAALNGDPSMVSFRSSNFPSYYLATKRESPGEVWITPVDTTNVWDVQRVSWKMLPGVA